MGYKIRELTEFERRREAKLGYQSYRQLICEFCDAVFTTVATEDGMSEEESYCVDKTCLECGR